MAWNWQPIETAPTSKLVLVAVCKGSLQCPVRGDRYIAMAFQKPDGVWTLFGQGAIREDEFITHWIESELPPEFPAGEEMDLTGHHFINGGEVPRTALATNPAHVVFDTRLTGETP